jgi:hypothetical protein
MADHLDGAGSRLRQGGRLSAQHSAGGTLGVEMIGLALLMAELSVWVSDLEDGMPLVAYETR